MRSFALCDLAEVFNGKTPSKTEQRRAGFPVLKIRDIDGLGNFRGPFASFVDRELAEKLSDKIIRAGDILILNAAHNSDYVGSKSFFAGGSAVGALATGEWLIIRPQSTEVEARFLYYWSRSAAVKRRISSLVRGIHLYPADVAEIQLELPARAEQQRIVTVLDKADRLLRMTRHSLTLCQSLTVSVFRSSFGDLIENPKNWPEPGLGDHLESITSGSRGWAAFYAEAGDVFLRIQNVGWGALLLNDVAHVSPPKNAEAKRTRVKPGDVLLSITADLGRSAWIPAGFPTAYISQHLALLRPKNINPIFLAALLSSDSALHRWGALDRDAVKSGLNFDDIRGFKIILPPRPLQDRFADFVMKNQKATAMQRAGLHDAYFGHSRHPFRSITRHRIGRNPASVA